MRHDTVRQIVQFCADLIPYIIGKRDLIACIGDIDLCCPPDKVQKASDDGEAQQRQNDEFPDRIEPEALDPVELQRGVVGALPLLYIAQISLVCRLTRVAVDILIPDAEAHFGYGMCFHAANTVRLVGRQGWDFLGCGQGGIKSCGKCIGGG